MYEWVGGCYHEWVCMCGWVGVTMSGFACGWVGVTMSGCAWLSNK